MLGMMVPHWLTPGLLLDHITWAVTIFIIPSWLILTQWHLYPGPTCWIGSGGNQGGGGGAYSRVDGRHFNWLTIPSGMGFGDGSVRSCHMMMWGRGRLRWKEALQRCCCWGWHSRSIELTTWAQPMLFELRGRHRHVCFGAIFLYCNDFSSAHEHFPLFFESLACLHCIATIYRTGMGARHS